MLLRILAINYPSHLGKCRWWLHRGMRHQSLIIVPLFFIESLTAQALAFKGYAYVRNPDGHGSARICCPESKGRVCSYRSRKSYQNWTYLRAQTTPGLTVLSMNSDTGS